MWVARNKDNSLWLFNTNKPIRSPKYDSETDSHEGEDEYWICGDTNGIEDYDYMYDIIILPHSLFPTLRWEDEPIEVSLSENGINEKYEELKDSYDALHMTYLSQVSLYKSLYEEEKKKNL